MRRTAEQLEYHAAKEREYRRLRMQERKEARAALVEAAALLRGKYGHTLGELVDLIATKNGDEA